MGQFHSIAALPTHVASPGLGLTSQHQHAAPTDLFEANWEGPNIEELQVTGWASHPAAAWWIRVSDREEGLLVHIRVVDADPVGSRNERACEEKVEVLPRSSPKGDHCLKGGRLCWRLCELKTPLCSAGRPLRWRAAPP